MRYIGKSVFKTRHEPHSHSFWEIVCNVEGDGVLILDGGSIPLSVNTVICIPPNTVHGRYAAEGFCDMWLHVNDFYDIPSDRVTLLSDDAGRSILNMMRALFTVEYGELPKKDAVSAAIIEAVKQMILARIEQKSLDERVEIVMSEMIDNLNNSDFSVNECLSSHGYCADHMRRLFKQQTGRTPVEYLTHIRIEAAKKLISGMKSSDITVTGIAQRVGYSDISYFSRAFRKATGKAPTEYYVHPTEPK